MAAQSLQMPLLIFSLCFSGEVMGMLKQKNAIGLVAPEKDLIEIRNLCRIWINSWANARMLPEMSERDNYIK